MLILKMSYFVFACLNLFLNIYYKDIIFRFSPINYNPLTYYISEKFPVHPIIKTPRLFRTQECDIICKFFNSQKPRATGIVLVSLLLTLNIFNTLL